MKILGRPTLDFMVGGFQSFSDLRGPTTHIQIKFQRNRTICGRVIAIWRLKIWMEAPAILELTGSWFSKFHSLRGAILHQHAKFRRNGATHVRLSYWRFSNFSPVFQGGPPRSTPQMGGPNWGDRAKSKAKAKASDSYIARLTGTKTWPDHPRFYNHQKWQLIGKSQWCCSANAAVHCTRTRGSS